MENIHRMLASLAEAHITYPDKPKFEARCVIELVEDACEASIQICSPNCVGDEFRPLYVQSEDGQPIYCIERQGNVMEAVAELDRLCHAFLVWMEIGKEWGS